MPEESTHYHCDKALWIINWAVGLRWGVLILLPFVVWGSATTIYRTVVDPFSVYPLYLSLTDGNVFWDQLEHILRVLFSLLGWLVVYVILQKIAQVLPLLMDILADLQDRAAGIADTQAQEP